MYNTFITYTRILPKTFEVFKNYRAVHGIRGARHIQEKSKLSFYFLLCYLPMDIKRIGV